MPDPWYAIRELLLADDAVDHGKRGRRTERALREAIRSGRVPPGTRLPSSRDLARQLDVARGTVTAAYRQLTAEGYVSTRPGSGTYVAASSGPGPVAEPAAAPTRYPAFEFDLRTGIPALSDFPRTAWLAATKRALAELPDAALAYPDTAGLPSLRQELTAYLGRVRAVTTTADGVLVTHGAAEALALLARALRDAGHRRIAVEDPCYPGQVELLSGNGLEPVPVPVDDAGLDVEALRRTGCRAVVITAAHQYPLGVVLQPRRRLALLEWAADNDALIVEDDYDAEHRYDRPAVAALQGLAPTRVAYIGTTSKTLAPGLRLGWLVAPARFHRDVLRGKDVLNRGGSVIEHAAFATFLRHGGYDRHLGRTRRMYRQRRDALVEALATRLPHWRPTGVAAGLHVVVRLPPNTSDSTLAARLADAGVNVIALSRYMRTDTLPFPGLVIAYAATTPDRLRAAVDRMAQVTTTSVP
ncbi:PLP-dependent aminotransferase family protein [Stackebrandtia nassauensis]|uniref:Transcriptional regulator, GntR family with aminotransferase domain protein n=1 Tax=Stackebrandtia nassauensis (strain DSM 44728 / CIP 108903 / NRRL B-16338 / NBRC 102104 / LLR-40K-21) TaxID=446470 RepID=D3PUH2_STANL|nr:PLP-dependent aminotransferase family protein [Stackebrandtia nassauensis]ADD42985.1 transcriptional regulator, GntR family with aminotransferase domain protein [Stackebrandtia nassauensis DSM 44728]